MIYIIFIIYIIQRVYMYNYTSHMFVKDIFDLGNSTPKAGFASMGNIRPMEYVNMTNMTKWNMWSLVEIISNS